MLQQTLDTAVSRRS